MDSKVEIIVAVCEACANLLLDPTNGGVVTLSGDDRAKARETAHTDLMLAVDTLAANATFNEGYYEVLNIAAKLNINAPKKNPG